MLNDEICKARDELNKSIEEGKDYSIIYDLSVKLDKLIAKFYQIETNWEVGFFILGRSFFENFFYWGQSFFENIMLIIARIKDL